MPFVSDEDDMNSCVSNGGLKAMAVENLGISFLLTYQLLETRSQELCLHPFKNSKIIGIVGR